MDYARFLLDYRAWLLIGVVALPYLAMPCLIKRVQRFRRHFSLHEFDPAEIPLPSQVSAFFQHTVEQMELISFPLVHHFLVPDLLPNATAVFAVFENRVREDAAIAVVMYGFQDESRKKVLLQEKYVEFSTEFGDNSEISTNNSRQESAFKQVSRRRIVQFPDTEDASTLYLAHQRLIERLGKPPKQPLPAPGQWEEELRRDMSREFSEQLDTGYLQLDASQEFFVMTWKGAYLMTWKQMWPISQIRRTHRRRKARELLAEFGHA